MRTLRVSPQVVDLLASVKSEPLPVRQSSSRGFYADGLLLLPCPTIQDAIKMLCRGEASSPLE